MLTVGDTPSRCPDVEIARLKARTDERGIIRLPPPPGPKRRRRIAAGTKVSIIGGPFQGLHGLHTGLTAREREIVLLDLLGAQRRVEIDPALVLVRQA